MIYQEYEVCKAKYRELQRNFDEVLTEKERLFVKTQPKAITYDKDKVQSGHSGNTLEDYVVSCEEKHIDDKLNELKRLLEDRGMLLKVKEEELRRSQDKKDKIYTLLYLDCLSFRKVAEMLNYSKTKVQRINAELKRDMI